MTLRAYVLRDRKPVHEPDITKAILFAADRKNVQVGLDASTASGPQPSPPSFSPFHRTSTENDQSSFSRP